LITDFAQRLENAVKANTPFNAKATTSQQQAKCNRVFHDKWKMELLCLID